MDDRGGQSLNRWRWLGWLVSLAALAFVGRLLWATDPQVWSQLRRLNLPLALVSLLLLQGWFLLRFSMWEMVSRHFGVADERRSHLRMWAFSEFARYVPGNVWSFAARYRGARQRGSGRPGATLSLIIEAANLVAGAAVVTAIFLRPWLWALWMFSAVAYVLLIPWVLRQAVRWRRWEFPVHFGYRSIVQVLVLSFLTWSCYGLAQAMIIKALPGISTPSVLILSAANVAAWLVGYLSIITPMGLGVREIALASFLAQSVADGVGSVLAVLTRIWLVCSELVFLGLVLLVGRRRT